VVSCGCASNGGGMIASCQYGNGITVPACNIGGVSAVANGATSAQGCYLNSNTNNVTVSAVCARIGN
jgi:hypothetical protein